LAITSDYIFATKFEKKKENKKLYRPFLVIHILNESFSFFFLPKVSKPPLPFLPLLFSVE